MTKNPRRRVVSEETVTEPFFQSARQATYGTLECGHRELLRVNGTALRSSKIVACEKCGDAIRAERRGHSHWH
jgi:hypothetical protein